MMSSMSADLDLIEELRLRRWARENYVPYPQRLSSWHPVIHDEMGLKDRELRVEAAEPAYAWSKS